MEVDVIIVGGGIAGLYCAYLCRKYRPEWRVLVLEKNAVVGGRMGTHSFHGVPVAMGAGIGRQKKDKRLQRLLAEMQIPTTTFKAANGYSAELASVCMVKKTFLFLKKTFEETAGSSMMTFKDFARPLLGAKAYKQFITCAGYTDYERAGAADVFSHYSFQDNYAEFEAIGVPWQQLLDQLVAAIGPHRIQTGATVVKIEEDDNSRGDYYVVATTTAAAAAMYRCTKVVLATTVDVVRRLCPKDTISIYRQIHSQPFLRIYGKFTKQSMARMKEYMLGQRTVVVSGPIHKIITMNEAAGVVMVAYTDNAGALALKKFKANTKSNRAMLCRLLERALGAPSHSLKLVSMVDFYWLHGTHYYGPLRGRGTRAAFIRAAQRPRQNFFVAGEMVSLHQGWVEGALESIDKISTDLFSFS